MMSRDGRRDAAAVCGLAAGVDAGRLAALTRMTRDLQLAEDLAQDALVAALDRGHVDGIPTNPAAWLMAVAKRRAIDHFRRAETERRAPSSWASTCRRPTMPDLAARSTTSRTTSCG